MFLFLRIKIMCTIPRLILFGLIKIVFVLFLYSVIRLYMYAKFRSLAGHRSWNRDVHFPRFKYRGTCATERLYLWDDQAVKSFYPATYTMQCPGQVEMLPKLASDKSSLKERCASNTVYMSNSVVNHTSSSIFAEFTKTVCWRGNEKFNISSRFKIVADKRKELRHPLHFLRSSLQLNILIIFFDSLSAVDCGRFLNRASSFFVQRLNALVYNGFNSINSDAIKTLKTLFLLKDRNGPSRNKRKSSVFLWNKLKEQGYATQLAADTNDLLRADVTPSQFDHVVSPMHIINATNQNASCFGSVRKHEVLLHAVRSFFDVNSHRPKFSLLHLTQFSRDLVQSHDALDLHLASFLEAMHRDQHFDTTLVVLTSAHGQTSGEYRQTIQGRVEERMAYLAIRYPPSMTHSYLNLFEHVYDNSQRLTTVHDLRQTLLQVAGVDTPRNQFAFSFFENIPRNRSCKDAGVRLHYCAFLRYTRAAKKHNVQEKSSIVLQNINARLQPVRQRCAEVRVHRVTRFAKLLSCTDNIVKRVGSVLHGQNKIHSHFIDPELSVFNIMMTAGHTSGSAQAHFDATLVYNASQHLQSVDVSRTDDDARGACVVNSHPHLVDFCFCR